MPGRRLTLRIRSSKARGDTVDDEDEGYRAAYDFDGCQARGRLAGGCVEGSPQSVWVSQSLRARVEAAVRDLNYRPLASARALRGRGQAIGILMQEIANPFFPEILEGVAQALAPEEYQTFLGIGHFQEAQQDRMVETMLDRQMDGLILVAPSMPIEAIQRRRHSNRRHRLFEP
jgi:DNA-binding LacI/PurR family transcriptional regulator